MSKRIKILLLLVVTLNLISLLSCESSFLEEMSKFEIKDFPDFLSKFQNYTEDIKTLLETTIKDNFNSLSIVKFK